jgi:anti-anti-sigma factor
MLADLPQIDRLNNLITVTFPGPDVTGMQMRELTTELRERIRYDNAQHFVLDMKNVMFIDSACLGSLVEFMQELEHVRGRIALASCGDNVAFLFKVTRLDSVFPLCDDVEEACLSVKGK